MENNITEHAYDSETGNQVHFRRINKMGHDWIYVAASRKRNFVTNEDYPCPFNIIHAPDCPCILEGVSVKIHNSHLGKVSDKDLDTLKSLKEAYNASFRGDEAECWDDIINRMTGKQKPYPGVNTYVAVITDKRIPVGALVIEHYTRPNILLLTYGFICEQFRRSGKHYAKHLIKTATDEVCRLAEIPDNETRTLFEGENPDKMTAKEKAMAPFNPRHRLSWFKSIGGKRLDFNYEQPPLSPKQNPVTNLDLYCIGREDIKVSILKAFLKEFYHVLGTNVAEEDRPQYERSLERQLNEIEKGRIGTTFPDTTY